ncbi:class I SAM-dependent methyltransferase [Prochlorococcus sp. MIT 1223]|uniref:class I SAM-dependent methyltransferase n=1 Tax=Prochlorococcus sp. MIT 1223 TaxID=3096217 RepID=UPI002A74FA68|nr:class I SAM-dependent methyltransferase [Prochlorococcus sp. MIT 1223]
MHRIPEPELMTGFEQVKAYSESDFSSSDADLVERIEEYIFRFDTPLMNDGVIIDMGCGPGNITERLASKWPKSKIYGIDGSQEMLNIARARKISSENPKLKGISYLNSSFSLLLRTRPEMINSADLIVSNSVLHHIHHPIDFWRTLKKIGKEGCLIFQRDLRRPCSAEKAIDLQRKYQSDSPEVLKKDYLASLYAAFTINEVKEQLVEAGLFQLKVFEVDDRYLEIVGVI